MGRQHSVGIYFGNRAWFKQNDFSWFCKNTFEDCSWAFPNPQHPQTRQSLRLTKKICEKVARIPDLAHHVAGQATAVYEAVIEENNAVVREDIIVKIFMRIPDIDGKKENDYIALKDDLLEKNPPVEEDLSIGSTQFDAFDTETYILKYLSDKGCTSTPQYISDFEINKENPWTLNGFLGFVVMTKVPGVTVSDIWPKFPTVLTKEQRQILNAFKEAYLEVRRLGVDHGDAALRNVIWDKDKSKCYLIDFESCELYDTPEPNLKWEEMYADRVHPDHDLLSWGFENEETRQIVREFRKSRQSP